MTGYGEARAQFGTVAFVCRARSVNHRFLDLKIRLPRADVHALDAAIRKRASELFRRGAIELTVSAERPNESSIEQLNARVAQGYWKELNALAKKLKPKPKAGVALDALLRLPGVVGADSPESPLETLEPESLLKKLVDPALKQLQDSRATEGKKLAKHILGLIDEMDGHVAEIKRQEPGEKERAREAMMERARETMRFLSSISPGAKTDDFTSRLREEATLWVERRDFEEERMRLEMHLADFRRQISGKDPAGVSGRKLEFLQQEILREINTLGTKAQSNAITTRTIELKTLLERIREQLANVA
jgi:uncharacterized protein (TIGR00255 family)